MESGVVTLRRNRADRRNKPSNKLVGLAVVVIVIALVLFFNSRSKEIQACNAEDAARIEELESNIEAESRRAEDLEEYSKYVNTKQFVEEAARDKLGLVYPDEKVLKDQDK